MSADNMIAVVGMACRFPGAPDVAAFWDLIESGREGLTRFDEAAAAARGVPAALRRDPNYVPVAGIIDGYDEFDAAHFGFTAAEAALLDPQLRVLLECCRHACDDAGHGGGADLGAVGVFTGAAHSVYLEHNLAGYRRRAELDPMGHLQATMGALTDYYPQQIAYRLGFTGPAFAVQATCSSSLVAVHLAAQSLLLGECDAALAGGVSLIVPQGRGYLHVPDAVFAADGHTRSFGANASGMVHTPGAGVVVLRRLADALADGDPVYAVLRGSAANNDGAAKAGFTAPSVAGQARVVIEALAVADIDPGEVGLIEAHGTGTVLGDRIELTALATVFGDRRRRPLAIGSVKSNIGHTNTAAGIAALIKAVLAVQHGKLPATLHADPADPEPDRHAGLFEIVAQTRDWPGEQARIAGVSSFGIGGTNCHVMVAQAPAPPAPTAPDPRAQLIPVSATDAAACQAQVDAYAAAGAPADLAYTAAVARHPDTGYRAALVRTNGAAEGDHLVAVRPVPQQRPRILFAFPGAGSQYPGMGAELYRDEPVFAAVVDECAQAMRPVLGVDIREIITAAQPHRDAEDPRLHQPALFAVSLATAATLRACGIEPDGVLGHSLGEFAAAVSAGMLAVSDAARLVAVRASALAETASGAMLAVTLDATGSDALLARYSALTLAAVNAAEERVLAGPASVVAEVAADLAARGVRHSRVRIGLALHSPAVEAAVPPVRAAAAIGYAPATIPFYSTHTGAETTTVDAEYWARQLREPVLFAAALDAATAAGPTILIQIGPGAAVAAAARRDNRENLVAAVTTFPDAREAATGERAALLTAVGHLWCAGTPFDPAALHRRRHRVRLPGYPFQRSRYWIDPPATEEPEPDPTSVLQLPTWTRIGPPTTPLETLHGTTWMLTGLSGPSASVAVAALTDAGATVSTADSAEPTEPIDGVVVSLDPLRSEPVVTEGTVDDPAVARIGAALAVAGDAVRRVNGLRAAPRAVLVVNSSSASLPGESPRPEDAATSALGRVIADETTIRCRTVDLAAETAPLDLRALAAEAADLLGRPADAPYAEIAHRAGIRWRWSWTRWEPMAGPRSAPLRLVVILGGFGRLGTLLAEHFAAAGAQVVRAGRSAPQGTAAATTSYTDRIVDITDCGALGALFTDIATEHGGIDLVVHAAGSVGAQAIAGLSEYTGAPGVNLRAKVEGTRALAEAVAACADRHRPRRVLLMSSVAGALGGVGLAEYAVANRFLDEWSQASPAADGTRWSSVVWDTWDGDDRVNASALAAVRAAMLAVPDALTALDRLLALGELPQAPAVLAVSPRSLDEAARRPAAGGPAITDPTTPAIVSTGDLTEDQQVVAALWSELLGVPVTGPDADFFALGGHSVLATRMLDLLRTREQAEIRLRDLIAEPTLFAVADLMRRRRQPGVDTAAEPARQPATAADGTFPLTRVQHAYWIGRSGGFGLGDVACHFYFEHDCVDLDLDRYERAWNRVIDRHDMLRTVITDDGCNRVLEAVPEYRIRRHNLAAAPASERADRLAELRRQLSHRVQRPDRWPLFDVRAVRLDDTTVRLCIGIDALICDSASYFLLDRDLRRYYREPEAELPTPRTRFADYVAHIGWREDSTDYARAAAYWRRRLPELPGAPALPTRTRAQARPWFGRRRAALPPQRWTRLRELAVEHGVTVSAVLLTAYADVLAAWSGDERFAVMLTLVDRPVALPDIDQVVGDFTALIVHEVDSGAGGSFADRVKRTQARLFDDLDHRAYSALDGLAELATGTGTRTLLPVVFTSALDVAELVGGEPDLEWAGRIVHGVSQTPQVWLDHQVFVQAGALQLQWDVLETVLDPAAADTAFGTYVDWVGRLSAGPQAWTAVEDGPNAGTDPQAEITTTVTGIWCRVLGLEAGTIAPESTFVAIGGDSVLAVRMAAMVRTELGVTVPVTDLVGDLTLAQLVSRVLEHRSGPVAAPAATTELVHVTDAYAPFALTPLQQAYWVGQHDGWALSYESAHMYVDFLLTGVDGDGVRTAVQRLVQRQPMLRAVFSADGNQQVLPVDEARLAQLPVTEIDLRTAPVGDIDAAVIATRTELQHSGPNLDPWPFRVVALRLPDEALRLHIVTSLLVADGWSFQLIFTELFTYLDEPNAVLPPLTAQFGDYVETVRRQRGEASWLAQRDWWWEQIDDLPAAPALPLAMPVHEARPEAMVRRELRLPGDRMDVLRARCTEFGITPSTLFATCYALALARLAGHRRFLLNVLYLNRLHLPADLDHAVGPYAGTVLVDIDVPADATFVAAARRVQAAMGRTLDHGQVTGVEVVRELARRRRDHAPQAPVVFHSTLGLHPPTGTPEAVRVRDFFQRVRTPQVALDMQVFEWDWDDEVVVNLDAVAELFAPGVLDELFADITGRLAVLADSTAGWTRPLTLPAAEQPAAATATAAPAALAGPLRTPVEHAVAEIWADLLADTGVLDPVAVDRGTDFFALGGDSVLAIRMLGRLRARLGATVAPREFLRDPTLAATAVALEARIEVEPAPALAEETDAAITIRDGAGAPLFLIHPTGGDVSCYLDLSSRLDTDRPVIAIQDPALAGHPGPEGIDGLATVYERTIRAQQPHGPYLLGGWSMGGIVAHEVARRLRAGGSEIALLVLIDSNIADRIHDADGARFWSRYLGSLESFLDIDLGSATLDSDFAAATAEQQRARMAAVLAEAGLLRQPDPAELAPREEVFRRHLRALGAHRTGRLTLGQGQGRLVIVAAGAEAPRNSGVGMGVDDCGDLTDLGWSAYTDAPLDTATVAAHHYALLREPAVADLARVVSRALSAVPTVPTLERSADA
ncbi:type I polyketide synthase [Nocardia speluncae]|uniref:Type I polyketide synthase n=1 Tax=Nocardia speluncae TaxID=419477 RepID=A0A846XA67_9NOCA|nr:type I polyketide synthase [Nocardia speluncae]NKY33161.1 type I polyketide synthase [Nocardia speluncae]